MKAVRCAYFSLFFRLIHKSGQFGGQICESCLVIQCDRILPGLVFGRIPSIKPRGQTDRLLADSSKALHRLLQSRGLRVQLSAKWCSDFANWQLAELKFGEYNGGWRIVHSDIELPKFNVVRDKQNRSADFRFILQLRVVDCFLCS